MSNPYFPYGTGLGTDYWLTWTFSNATTADPEFHLIPLANQSDPMPLSIFDWTWEVVEIVIACNNLKHRGCLNFGGRRFSANFLLESYVCSTWMKRHVLFVLLQAHNFIISSINSDVCIKILYHLLVDGVHTL